MALYIYLESPERASWVRMAADGEVKGKGQGALADIETGGERAVVLVPGADVLLSQAEVPGHKRRLLAQAIPYAMEEQLVEDVEELHFALGAVDGDRVNVAVVSRARMDEWLAQLRQAGIEAEQLVPDVLALPLQENSWQLLRFDDRLLLRSAPQTGMVMDAANAALTLNARLNESEDKPDTLQLQDFSHGTEPLAGLDVETVEQPAAGLPVSVLAAGFDERQAINLLQGRYSRRERIGRYWRPWRVAAALLLGFVVVRFAAGVVQHQQLAAQKVALNNEIEQIYRQAFPEARKVVNAKVQMERALNSLRGGGSVSDSGFAELLAQAGRQFSNTPGLNLQRLSYKGGQLDVSLLISDLQQLDQLKQRLVDQAGLQVEIQSASARDNLVEARLRIKGVAS
jgi:general secretion pathway protein L